MSNIDEEVRTRYRELVTQVLATLENHDASMNEAYVVCHGLLSVVCTDEQFSEDYPYLCDATLSFLSELKLFHEHPTMGNTSMQQ